MEMIVNNHKPDHYVFEALSFASVGNATRNLAQLYGSLMETLMRRMEIDRSDITAIPPTSLKAFARKFLPEDEQIDGYTKAGKPKLVKMDKKLMVRVVDILAGKDYLKGYNYSTGKDDLADSFLLGYKYLQEIS